MIRAVLGFVLLTAVFFLGIQALRQLSGKEQLQLLKLISYSILCSVMSAVVLTAIVVLF